jgi:hypothetical protein
VDYGVPHFVTGIPRKPGIEIGTIFSVFDTGFIRPFKILKTMFSHKIPWKTPGISLLSLENPGKPK